MVLTYAGIELRLDNLVGFDGDSDEGICDGEQWFGASLVHHALNTSLSSSEWRLFKLITGIFNIKRSLFRLVSAL